MYETASTEPLDIIRANECEARPGLATSRFQALWNEIERLRAENRALRTNVVNDRCEIERLRAALKPFAVIGLDVLESHPGWANAVFAGEWCGYRLTYVQFEAAAAIVSKQNETSARPRP